MKRQQNNVLIHLVIILIISIVAVSKTTPKSNVDKVIAQERNLDYESLESVASKTKENSEVKKNTDVAESQIDLDEKYQYPFFTYSKDWDMDDEYLLAKIAMAEAEGESIRGKSLVIMVVLNRVHSNEFPNTIKEVILQESNGIYQFSPVSKGGRWWTVEPNKDCWEAVRMIKESAYDFSGGALYFESVNDENSWHSRNLEFLYETGNHKFYK